MGSLLINLTVLYGTSAFVFFLSLVENYPFPTILIPLPSFFLSFPNPRCSTFRIQYVQLEFSHLLHTAWALDVY